MGRAFYNENDPAAAHVLNCLINDGVIAPGIVDARSIKELQPHDLNGFTQVHLFAGGGLWSVAARLAGWPDDRPLWTGSCPCQPFSAAGKGGGVHDSRHLWPDFFRLVRACRPTVVMGEQVAGKAGYGWFDGVRADLAREGYACRGVDIPACAVDAPHIRQRLYWIAVEGAGWKPGAQAVEHPAGDGREQGLAGAEAARYGREPAAADRGHDGSVAHAEGERRREGLAEPELRGRWPAPSLANASGVTQGDAFGSRLEGHAGHGDGHGGRPVAARPVAPADGSGVADDDTGGRGRRAEVPERRAVGRAADERPAARNGSFWAGAEWLACHDGKARRAESGIRLLVDGLPGRVGLWRIAGNAIVAPLAAEVIAAFLDAECDIFPTTSKETA